MKKALALSVAAVILVAGWYWWDAAPGNSTSGGTGAAPPPTAAPLAVTQAQQQLVDAQAGIANILRPAVAAEKKPDGQAARVRALLDEVDRSAKNVPRDTFDTAAVVATVGRDRTALFAWVRDHTVLVPYSGSLRGPTGVLMDRLGNSLDRALLLAALLDRAGFEVRLATGSLDEQGRSRVLGAMASRPRPTLPPMPEDGDALRRLAQGLGVSSEQLGAQLKKVDDSRRALMDEAQARIASQAAALQSAVGAAPASAPPAVMDDHWWVQVEQDGAWIDLDPTLPDAKPGDTVAAAQTTLAPADLGDERRHVLKIRVMAEVWRNGVRSEEALLEHAFSPSQFHGQRIALLNVPIDWPADAELLNAERPAEAVRKALVEQVEWVPVLKIGRGMVVKMSIDDHGELHDNTSPDANATRLGRNVARVTQQALQGATDLFSQLPGGAGDAIEPKPERTETVAFTSEWIEFELQAPGRDPSRARRVVFDLLSEKQRAGGGVARLGERERLARALALTAETELLPLFAEFSRPYIANLIATRLSAARGPLLTLAGSVGKPIPPQLKEQLGSLEPVPGLLYAVADARFSWNPNQGATYLDRLNLLAYHSEMRVSDAGAFLSRQTIDFVANAVAVWPAPGRDASRMQLAQGVADTVVEGSLMASCPAGRTDCVRGDNTSEAFAATNASTWKMLPASTSGTVPGIPEHAQPFVQADLRAGYAVMLPATPIAIAGRPVITWWRVNPRTGETLGMSIDGGSVSAETVITLINVGLSFLNCVPLLRSGLPPPGSARELQAMMCISAGVLGGAVLGAALIGAQIGALGAAAGLLSTFVTMDWPGILGP
jgi:hypothetical protein